MPKVLAQTFWYLVIRVNRPASKAIYLVVITDRPVSRVSSRRLLAYRGHAQFRFQQMKSAVIVYKSCYLVKVVIQFATQAMM